MAEVAAQDPELVEEFQFVERIRSIFKTGGVTLVFWEAYCLVQNNRAALRRVADRASSPETAGAAPELPVDILTRLRRQRRPQASRVQRDFFGRHPRSFCRRRPRHLRDPPRQRRFAFREAKSRDRNLRHRLRHNRRRRRQDRRDRTRRRQHARRQNTPRADWKQAHRAGLNY